MTAQERIDRYRQQNSSSGTSRIAPTDSAQQSNVLTERSSAQERIARYRAEHGPKDTAQTRAAARTAEMQAQAAERQRQAAERTRQVIAAAGQTAPGSFSFANHRNAMGEAAAYSMTNELQRVNEEISAANEQDLKNMQSTGALVVRKTPEEQARENELQQRKKALEAALYGQKKKADWGKVAQSAVYMGSDEALYGLASTADWIVGGLTKGLLGLTDEEYGSLNTPTTAFKNWVQKNKEQNERHFADAAGDSRGAQIAQEIGIGTVAALPAAVTAIMTAGASLPATATTTGLTTTAAGATATGTAALAGTVRSTIGTMAKNPQYWLSFMQVAGNNYEDAKADGASELEATSYALINGTLNAIVEVGGGGIDTLPKELKNGGKPLLEWVKSAIEEGNEEVVQGAIERGLQNLVYGKNNPIISVKDENAIFNPVTSAKEFGGGFAVGGILSAGEVGTSKAIDAGLRSYYRSGSYTEMGKAVRSAGDAAIDSVIDTARALGGEAGQLADRLNTRWMSGKSITDKELGKLYIQTVQQQAKETAAENAAVASENAGKISNNAEITSVADAKNATTPAGQQNAAPVEGTADAESTAVNDDPARHTAQEQRVIEEYKNAVDPGLVDFVRGSIANKGANKGRYYLNPVTERAAADIETLTGINVLGFKTAIEQRMAEHIYSEHGPNGTTDRSMSDLNDIGRIQYVLNNYDSISHGGNAPSYVTNKANGKHGMAQTVRYEKAVNGTYYVVEAVPDTNSRTAYIVSAYMSKGKRGTSNLQTADESTSAHTAKTENAVLDTPLAATIPQPSPAVNTRSGGVMLPTAESGSRMLPTAEEELRAQRAQRAETELERTGILAGVDDDTIASAKRVAEALGRDIRFYEGRSGENGYRSADSGIIYISSKSENPVMQIIGHEVTHSIEQSRDYQRLRQLVMGRIRQQGGDIKQLREAKIEDYERHGVTLTRLGAEKELVAEYIEKNLITDEESIYALVYQDRTLGQRILGIIDRILARLGNESAQERVFLTRARDYYSRALEETQRTELPRTDADNTLEALRGQLARGEISEEEFDRRFDDYYKGGIGLETRDGQYSFGRLRDEDVRARAEEMEREGKTPEEIWRELGAARTMDGKDWRYEIDDSGMEFRRGGDVRLMQQESYRRLQELSDKWEKSFKDGAELSAEEMAEMERLERLYSDDVWAEKYELSDFLRHDELFDAYPQLRHVSLRFDTLPGGTKGYFSKRDNTIVMSDALFGKDSDTLIHEIQHVIQQTDGLPGGTNPEYWARREYETGDLVTERLQRKYDSLVNSLPREDANRYARYMELERELERLFLADENSEDGRRYARLEQEQDALYEELYPNEWFKQLLDLERRMTDAPGEYRRMYENTAGEIEARDAAERRTLTAEERRERLPRMADEDTLFAESGDYAGEYVGTTADGTEIYETSDEVKQLPVKRRMEMFLNLMQNEYRGRTAKFVAPNGETYYAGFDEADVRKNIYGDRRSTRGGWNAKINAGADGNIFELVENARYARSGAEQGKNTQAHQGVTGWEYFVKTVQIDGKVYDLLANIRKKPEGEYVYSIQLAESNKKASALPLQYRNGTAKADNHLAVDKRSVRMPTDAFADTLSQDGDTVNPQFSLSRTPEEKKEIFRNLQKYIDGKVDTRELKRYVSSLDESIDYSAETDEFGVRRARLKTAAEESAERIVRQAHSEGTSVEEYLRRNWDEYEVDGRLGEDAQKALELERRQFRQWSMDESAENVTDETAKAGTPVSIRSTLPRKAQNYLERTERGLVKRIGDALSVPSAARREYLSTITQEISEEYLRDGRISDETANRLFETAYDEGVVADDEFYNQYKWLEDTLRTMPVSISEQDKADIPDFNSFRRSAFGSLLIKNEGGTPVDVAYEELRNSAPELFPAKYTYTADQLQQMLNVARSIQRAEKNLDEYYGHDAEEFKAWAKNDFGAAINDAISELRNVRRYADDRAQQDKPISLATKEEVAEAYKNLKEARKAYEKAAARNLLTQDDEIMVGRLLRGEESIENLKPGKNNVRGIKAVYEAKAEYEKFARQIRDWNESRRAELRKTADKYLETAINWKDKKTGFQYARETMERNIRDIVEDPEIAESVIAEYFTPVHKAQAESTRLKNRMRDRVRALNLSTKETKEMTKKGIVSEAHAVQLLGEAMDNIAMLENSRMDVRDGKTLEEWRRVVADIWANNPQLDRAKIENAIAEFRSIYDELFEMMNESRLRNGYEPVNYRKGYFPHFQPGDGDGIIGLFGKALGIKTDVTALPTTINGLTHTFKPGIQWFSGAQQRLGFETAYNAVEGFDRYIEGVADVIYQTDNIQKLRALATQIRYRSGDEGIRKQIDAVRENMTLSEQDKQDLISSISQEGRYNLSNFVAELDEYTNLLANKKSIVDRNLERMLGRRMYNITKSLEGRIAANMVAVNPGSWLTNFIPIAQGWSRVGTKDLLAGMWQTLRNVKASDGIENASTFLTNRRGSDALAKTWEEKASAALSTPMEWIDMFTAGSLVRARYNQNIRHGMSEEAAMADADAWTASVMADRSKGSTPTLFNQRNPLVKLLTQFQLEVNNQLSYLFKDIPREARDKGLGELALSLFKYCFGSWLYNEIYEYFRGRRPALDPIGMLNGTVGDATGYELPNLVELGVGAVAGDVPSFQTEKKNAFDTMSDTFGEIMEQVPFVGGLLGGGRIPISSALPNVSNLVNAATNGDWSTKKRLSTAGKELAKPATYLALPFGGGQVKKVTQGLDAVARGGSYSVDNDGNDILQYPVYTDTPGDTAKSVVQSTLFGKTATAGGREWVDSGFKSLNAKQTAAYQGLLETGMSQKEAYKLVKDVKSAGSKDSEKLKAIADAKLDDEETLVLAGMIMKTELTTDSGEPTEYARLIKCTEAGIKASDALDAKTSGLKLDKLIDLHDAGLSYDAAKRIGLALSTLEPEEGKKNVTSAQKWRAVVDTAQNAEEETTALKTVMTEKQFSNLEMAKEYGVETESFVRLKEILPEFDADGSGSYSQAEYEAAIDSMGGGMLPGNGVITTEQQAVLWQLYADSKDPMKNPYSKAIARKIVKAMKEREDE